LSANVDRSGQGGRENISDAGIVAALRRVLNTLQGIVDEKFEIYRKTGTCSREFIAFIDSLEDRASKEMIAIGFQKLQVIPERKSDIVLGVFAANNLLVEIGLKDINRCGILEEITGGRPPRVYARLYIGGKVAAILEAEETRGIREAETGYII
jgi:hypothetical protein